MDELEIKKFYIDDLKEGRIETSVLRKNTFLSNPFKELENMPLLYQAYYNEKAVGMVFTYPSAILIDREIHLCNSGSLLCVDANYRGLGIGKKLGLCRLNSASTGISVAAGLTPMSFPLYKKLGCNMFESPRLGLVINSQPVLKALLPSIFSSLLWPFINICLLLLRLPLSYTYRKLSNYDVSELEQATYEIEDIVSEDNHRFSELHNKEWFDWQLNNTFDENPIAKQKLYEIKMNNVVVGFFMIKIRIKDNVTAHKFRNLKVVSLVEWGVSNKSQLTEFELVVLAIKKMILHQADLIELSFLSKNLMKKLRRYGFIKMFEGNIGIYISDNNPIKQVDGIFDETNWRLRPAYSDCAFA